jgi:hypothetical protein
MDSTVGVVLFWIRRPVRWGIFGAASPFAISLAMQTIGCSGPSDPRFGPSQEALGADEAVCVDGGDCSVSKTNSRDAGPGTEQSDASAACDEGSERHCKIILGSHDGVTSCFEGKQRCHDGFWGACGEDSQ